MRDENGRRKKIKGDDGNREKLLIRDVQWYLKGLVVDYILTAHRVIPKTSIDQKF